MEYGPIPVSRYSEVIEHLRYNFFPDEPLNQSVDLCRRGEPHVLLEAHSLDTLKDEMSVMAIDQTTGQVITSTGLKILSSVLQCVLHSR